MIILKVMMTMVKITTIVIMKVMAGISVFIIVLTIVRMMIHYHNIEESKKNKTASIIDNLLDICPVVQNMTAEVSVTLSVVCQPETCVRIVFRYRVVMLQGGVRPGVIHRNSEPTLSTEHKIPDTSTHAYWNCEIECGAPITMALLKKIDA